MPYDLSDLRLALRHPVEAIMELNRLYHTRLRTREFDEAGENFFERDWDNLLILDACRYDTFAGAVEEDRFSVDGTLESIRSRGSCTPEFLRGNLPEADLSDTVYVTGTTMLYRNSVLSDEVDHDLHAVVDAWEDSIDVGEWGVSPTRMERRAREAAEEFPEKRLVVHFIQPHIPFVGEYGRERFADAPKTIWSSKRYGELDASDGELWRAYRENLDEVLPAAERLCENLTGRTVVTSDHGQLIGDRASPLPVTDYGHPNGVYCDELSEVPWFVADGDGRRTITSGDGAVNYDEKDRDELDEKAREHLENLGYV